MAKLESPMITHCFRMLRPQSSILLFVFMCLVGLLIVGSGVVGCAMARLGRSESLICVALLRLLIFAGVAWVGGVISGLFGGGSRLSSDERHVMESDMWATAGFDGAAVSADPVANVESAG